MISRAGRRFLAVVGSGLLAVAPASAQPGHSAPPAHGMSAEATDCGTCHSCAKPTVAEPCLRSCPRHTLHAERPAGRPPQVILLDQLEDLYVPVRFDHETHARMTEISSDCTICHHYTPTGEQHPACRSCHPSEILHEDLAQPGLKGAYHRQCLGCHAEWDRDTACEACHEKRAGGRLNGTATGAAVHTRYAPVRLEELITFSTEYEEGDQVPFHHQQHSERYETDCGVCHREQSCDRCHTQGVAVHPMGDPAEVDLHDYCFRCHREEDDPCHPDDACSHCHGRAPDDLFSHSSVGWKLAAYHAKLACGACHGPWTASAPRPDRHCVACHRQGWSSASFDHRVTGVRLDEVHADADCADCHGAGYEVKPTCGECHDDDRTYSKAVGFGD